MVLEKKTWKARAAALLLAAASGVTYLTGGLSGGLSGSAASYIPTLNTDGYYEIGTAEQLDWFAEEVNSGNNTINGILTADIVYNEDLLDGDGNLNDGNWIEWTPIGSNSTSSFEGNFDGDGYTISGLYCDALKSDFTGVGLFGCVDFDDSSTTSIQDVTVEDSYFVFSGGNVGGIVGYCSGAKGVSIQSCTVRDSYVYTSQSGTYAGYAYCYATAGGICGYANGYTNFNFCENDNTFVYGELVGGIVGYCSVTLVSTTYTYTVNGATMTGTSYIYGDIQSCHNSGTISGYLYAGGIIGADFYSDVYVRNCYNTGSILFYNENDFATGYGFGGIVGYIAASTAAPTFVSCYTAGTIAGTSSTNGLLGTYSYSAYSSAAAVVEALFTKCYYLASEESTSGYGKTEEQFASGEVCWEMGSGSASNSWVQTLGTEIYPSLNYFSGNSDVVYRVTWLTDDTFSEEQANATYYTYMNAGTPVPPEELIEDGYTYHYYETTTSGNLSEFVLEDTTVNSDAYEITISRAAQIQLLTGMISAMGGKIQISGTVGTTMNNTVFESVVTNQSDLGTLTYTLTAIPAGLTLNQESGLVTGTPTVAYPDGFEATLTISDTNGESVEIPVLFTILQQDPSASIYENDDNTVYYDGDALPDVNDILSSDINGTFVWTTDQDTLETGENTLTWKFTPDDDNYATVTGTVTITALDTVTLTTDSVTYNGAYGADFYADIAAYVSNADEVGGVTFSADTLPEGLELTEETGVISGVPTVIVPDGFDSILTITAGNGSTAVLSVTFVISTGTVHVTENNDNAVYYDGDALPDVNDVLTADIDGTFAWTTDQDTLETGSNTLTWIFTPTDSDNYGALTGTMKITALPVVVAATGMTTLNGVYGETFEADLNEEVYNADEVGGVTFRASGLPKGLSLDSETGLITGTPTSIYLDGFDVEVTVTAGNGSTAQFALEFIISRAEPEVVVDIPDTTFVEGNALPDVNDILSSDIDGTFVWTTDQDALEAGENTLTWKFTPSDTEHYKAVTGTVSISALAAISLATNAMTLNGVYGADFYADIAAYVSNADEVGGVTFRVNSLPKGLSLDGETGLITGVPTAVYLDGFDVEVTVTAGNGLYDTMQLEIIISKATPTITENALMTTYTEGDALPDVNDALTANIDGTFAWTTDQDALEAGENTLTWKFTPEDTDKYETVTGTITIDAEVMATTTTTTEATTTETTTTTTETTTTETVTTAIVTTETTTATTTETTTTETTTTTTETTTTETVTIAIVTTETTTTTTTETTTTETTTTTTETTTTTTTETTTTETTTTTTETTTTETVTTAIVTTETTTTAKTTTETSTTTTETTATTAAVTTTTTEVSGVLALSSAPDKVCFTIGEELDLTGLRVSVYLTADKTILDAVYENVSPLDYPDDFIIDTSEFDGTTAGIYSIAVRCSDTLAEMYQISEEITIPIEVTELDDTLDKGDVDIDGDVDIQDAYLILQYYANQAAGNTSSFSDDEEWNARIINEAADIDEDSLITINDASLTLQYYANRAAGLDTTWEQLLADRIDSYQ